MKILVTGVAGFIGSSFAGHLLNKGHTVVGVDNLSYGDQRNLPKDHKFSFKQIDIRSNEMKDALIGIDTVFHFAGISSLPECQSNPGEAISVNVGGTANVLECARLCNVSRVIVASTSALYENNEKTPFLETDGVQPDLIYSHSKLMCEELTRNFSLNYGIPTRAIRFFNVYGPHQSYLRKSPPLLGYIMSCVLKNESPQFFSDGNQKRDYIYIDDLIDLLDKFTEEKINGFEIYNACSGDLASVRDIYSEVQKQVTNSKVAVYSPSDGFWNNFPTLSTGIYPLNVERIRKEVNKLSLGSNKKAEQELGWKPRTQLSAGISKILAYVQGNKNIIQDVEPGN